MLPSIDCAHALVALCGRLVVVCASGGRVKTTRHFVCASTLLHMWHPIHHRQGFSVADGRRDDRATLLREMDARETETRPRCCLFDSRRRFADPGFCVDERRGVLTLSLLPVVVVTTERKVFPEAGRCLPCQQEVCRQEDRPALLQGGRPRLQDPKGGH